MAAEVANFAELTLRGAEDDAKEDALDPEQGMDEGEDKDPVTTTTGASAATSKKKKKKKKAGGAAAQQPDTTGESLLKSKAGSVSCRFACSSASSGISTSCRRSARAGGGRGCRRRGSGCRGVEAKEKEEKEESSCAFGRREGMPNASSSCAHR